MFLGGKEQEDIMIGRENRRDPGDLVAIARNASLYDWLINIALPLPPTGAAGPIEVQIGNPTGIDSKS
jgi:hypothetical protein